MPVGTTRTLTAPARAGGSRYWPYALDPMRAASRCEIGRGDVAHPEGDLLEAGDHQPLPLFDRLDVVGRLQQRLVRAGVEPRDAARQLLDVQLSALEVRAVDVGDLELAARRRLQAGGDVEHLVVVEVQPGDGVATTSAWPASPRG